MHSKIKYQRSMQTISLVALMIAAFAVSGFSARSADGRLPELPCADFQAPKGNKVSYLAYAIGVQIYRWNGTAWDFVAPEAGLFADKGYHGRVGIHFAGPTWESNSGSRVIAVRDKGCDPDPANNIPLLLLKAVQNDGKGIFSSVTYIHRLNTVGGVKPALPGLFTGEERRVPYTAEYYFYRAAESQPTEQ